jgi:hypothetical protein
MSVFKHLTEDTVQEAAAYPHIVSRLLELDRLGYLGNNVAYYLQKHPNFAYDHIKIYGSGSAKDRQKGRLVAARLLYDKLRTAPAQLTVGVLEFGRQEANNVLRKVQRMLAAYDRTLRTRLDLIGGGELIVGSDRRLLAVDYKVKYIDIPDGIDYAVILRW